MPVSAGGSADKLARTVAQKLGEKWKQSVVVENQPGASSAIGNAAVAHAHGDGYTLLLAGDALSLNALQPGKLSYDPLRDLRGVTKAVVNPQLLVVRPSLGVRTFQEFVELVRRRPGEIGRGQAVTRQFGGEIAILYREQSIGHASASRRGRA